MPGLTAAGFETKTLAAILEDIAASQRGSSALGVDIDTSPEQPLGQMNAIMAAKFRELWELGEVVYNARGPGGSSFSALDMLCALTGVFRLAATKGTVTLRVTLGAGVTLPAGSVVHVVGQTTNRWVTLANVTNSGGSPATFNAASESEAAGRFVANAGTLTVIATPVAGWTAVTTLVDAVPGRETETDTALRQRRDQVIRAGGDSPLDAVRAAMLRVPDVTQVVTFENDTDVIVGTMPPHSIEVMVTGGTDAAIGAALWAAKPGGIYAHGSVSVALVDASGSPQTVRFTRPTEVLVYVKVTVERDAARYAGDDKLKTDVAAVGDGYLGGDNVRLAALSRAAFAVLGVADVTEVLIGRTATTGRVAANLTIASRELARLDTARIEVVAVDVTP